MEAEKRLQALEKERELLLVEMNKKRGATVLLTADPRYSSLHEDLESNVAAEGRILIGPPHLLSFTYDDLNPSHVRRMVTTRREVTKVEEVEDMSDSDDSSSSSGDEGSNRESLYEEERMAIPSTSIPYAIDLPPYAKKGKRYDFFVLHPSD
jgi:hypothetical protein